MTKNKRDSFYYPDAGGGLAFGMVATMVVSVVAVVIYMFMYPEMGMEIMEDEGFLLFSSIVLQLGFIAYYFLFCSVRNVSPLKAGRFQPPKLQLFGLAVVVPFVAMFCFGFIANLFDYALISLGYESANALVDITVDSSNFFIYLIAIGILPAIGEELLFRGILLRGLEKRFGDVIAVVVSAAAFSLFHMSPDQTVFQFFLGLVMGYITLRSGSILPAIIIHFINNSFSLVMVMFDFSIWPELHPALLVLAAVLLTPLAVWGISLAIDACSNNLHKNFSTGIMLDGKIRAQSEQQLDVTDKKQRLIALRKEFLTSEKMKANIQEPMFCPVAPPLPTGDADKDDALMRQYEDYKVSLEARRTSSRRTSSLLLVLVPSVCFVFWLIALFNGFA